MSGPYPPGRASTLKFGHLLIQHTGCGCGFRRSVLPSSVGACAWSVACLAPVAVTAGRPRSMTCSARPALLPQLSSVSVSPRWLAPSISVFVFFLLHSSSFFFQSHKYEATGTAKGLVRRVGLLPTQHLPCALQRRPTERPAGGVRTHSPRQ